MEKVIQIPPSPFEVYRRDDENNTQIYVNYDDYHSWNSLKNYLIIGGRGSGKTSILNIFDYRNLWLKQAQIVYGKKYQNLDNSFQKIIGVLFRCEEVEISVWNDWCKQTSSDKNYTKHELVFATYLNYYFTEKIIEAIIEVRQHCNWVVDEEDDISALLKDIYEAVYPDENKRPSLYDYSFASLKSKIRNTYTSIRQKVITDFTPLEILGTTHCFSANSNLLKQVCDSINKHLKKFGNSKQSNEETRFLPENREKKMSFFILIDDVDRLTLKWQQKVINTFFSTKNEPCSFKVTCTGYSFSNVTVNEKSIGAVERYVSVLSDDSHTSEKKYDESIDELYSAIFNLRLKQYFESPNYDLEKIFGKGKDIETILVNTLKSKSIKPKAKKILEAFEKSNKDKEEKGEQKEEKITNYWLKANKIEITEGSDKQHVERKNLDKYRVSAVFSILNKELGDEVAFTYFGYPLIKMISGGSPRNFLRICNAMWDGIYVSLYGNKFPVNSDVQANGIKTASNAVFQKIEPDSFNREITASSKDVSLRLANLFKSFLSIDSLKITPECMSLELDISKLRDENKELFEKIIDNLLMGETIKTRKIVKHKIIDENSKNGFLKIALNPMLSPHFNLPYRSPFSYSFSITEPNVFLKQFLIGNDLDAEKLAKTIYNNRIKVDTVPSLFNIDQDE